MFLRYCGSGPPRYPPRAMLVLSLVRRPCGSGAPREPPRAMLDIKLLRDDSQKIAQNLADRHARVFADLGPADGPDWATRTPDPPAAPARPSPTARRPPSPPPPAARVCLRPGVRRTGPTGPPARRIAWSHSTAATST